MSERFAQRALPWMSLYSRKDCQRVTRWIIYVRQRITAKAPPSCKGWVKSAGAFGATLTTNRRWPKVDIGKNSAPQATAKIESRERTASSRRRRRPTGLRLRHKQFLLLVALAHYDFFALVSYAETGRVGGDRCNRFVDPFRSSIDR